MSSVLSLASAVCVAHVPDGVTLRLSDPELESVPSSVTEAVRDARDAVGNVTLREVDGVCVRERENVTDPVMGSVRVSECDNDGVSVIESVCVALVLGVADNDGVSESVSVPVRVGVHVREPVLDRVAD